MNYDPTKAICNPGRLVAGPTAIHPTSPTIAPDLSYPGPGGGCTPGDHQVAYSFIFATGESALSPASAVVTVPVGGSSLSLGTPAAPTGVGILSRHVYMTKANAPGIYYFLFNVAGTGSSGTGFNTPDSALGAAFAGATQQSPAFPYGGTPLGYVTKAKLTRQTEYAYADSEARGRSGVQTYRGMSGAALSFVLTQSMDPDVLNKTLPHDTTSGGGFSGANRLFLPQVGLTVGPGLVTPDSPLLFLADDPAHPSVLIYSPSWHEEETQEIDLVLDKAMEWALVVTAGLDATNRDLACDLLENLSL